MKSNRLNQWNRLKGILWEEYILDVGGIQKIIYILKIMFFLEFFALLSDLCPVNYWFGWIEQVVEYDISNVIPVVAITWGAVSIPMGFLLGQIEHRNYGIRLIDFLVASLGMSDSVFLIGSFWGQLVYIVLASTYNRPVLFTVVTWTQLMYIFCFFYLVMLSISHKAIENTICRQSGEICKKLKEKNEALEKELKNKNLRIQNNLLINYTNTTEMRHWLLLDMVKNIDYYRFEDVESLKKILVKEVCPNLRGLLGRKAVYDLFKIMLSVAEKEIIKQIAFDIFSAEVSVDTRKGILAALISERDGDLYQLCINLIENLEDYNMERSYTEHMFIWTILWGMHQKMCAMNPMERLQNDVFISFLQKSAKEYKIDFMGYDRNLFNSLILQSCLDIMMLTRVDVADRIIAQLFEYKLEF